MLYGKDGKASQPRARLRGLRSHADAGDLLKGRRGVRSLQGDRYFPELGQLFQLGVDHWETGYADNETSQDYSYQFKGKSSWKGDCRAEKGHSEVSIVAGGFYVDLTCTFQPIDSTASPWRFSFKGDRSDRATGLINLGSKTVTVGAIDRVESSPFKLGYNTGYYFHMDEEILGAVDTISKQGPVWMNNSLTQEERDKIAMVAVAFLLNQTNFDN